MQTYSLQKKCEQLNDSLYRLLIDHKKQNYISKYALGMRGNTKPDYARFGDIAKCTLKLLESNDIRIEDKLILANQFTLISNYRLKKYQAKPLYQRIIITVKSVLLGLNLCLNKVYAKHNDLVSNMKSEEWFEAYRKLSTIISSETNNISRLHTYCMAFFSLFGDEKNSHEGEELITKMTKILAICPTFFQEKNIDITNLVHDIYVRFYCDSECDKNIQGFYKVLQILSKISIKMRETTLAYLLRLSQILQIQYFDVELIFDEWCKIPENKINYRINQVEKFRERLFDPSYLTYEQEFNRLCHNDKELAKLIALDLLSIPDGEFLSQVISSLDFISSFSRKEYFKNFNHAIFENKIDDFFLALSKVYEDPDLCKQSHVYLTTLLQSTQISDEKKEDVYKKIENHYFQIRVENYYFNEQKNEKSPLHNEWMVKKIQFDPLIRVLHEPAQLFKKLKQHLNDDLVFISQIFKILPLFPSQYYNHLFEAITEKVYTKEELSSHSNEILIKILLKILATPGMLNEFHEHILNMLKSNEIPRDEKLALHNQINKYQKELQMNDHPNLFNEFIIQEFSLKSNYEFGLFQLPYEACNKLRDYFNNDVSKILTAFAISDFIPPEYHHQYLELISQASKDPQLSHHLENFQSMLFYAFSDSEIRVSSQARFLNALKSLDLVSEKKLLLCNKLIEYERELQINQDSPLFEEMVTQTLICDPHTLQSVSNPYRVYHYLKKQLEKEKDQVLSVNLPINRIADESLKWFVQKPEERQTFIYTKASIPADFSSETLKMLFDQLKNRLESLSESELEATINEIKQINHSKNLDDYTNNLLSDIYIKQLLELPKNESDQISHTQFYFYRSLQAIQEAFLLPQERSLLTQGENMLLSFSESVQDCPVGRSGGIANFYQLIPVKYKNNHAAMENETHKEAFKLIDVIVQEVLTKAISSDSFLKEVTDNASMAQSHHFILYLKNRLSQQINLPHTLVFDKSTDLIPEFLLKKEAEELLEIFYRHCSLTDAVEALVSHSTELLSKDTFSGIVLLLKQVDPHFEYETYFESDAEDETPIKITEKAAISLLKATKYACIAENVL